MKTLAIEFSSEQRSVAVLWDGKLRGCALEAGGRNTRAFGLINKALQEAQTERTDIECLVVGLGPGSYTGIRSAIAVAQGWQLATGADSVKLLGISSVECLALEARQAGWRGKVHVVIDARRGDLYHATYEITERSRSEISALRLAAVGEVQSLVQNPDGVAGPDCQRWFPQGRILFPSASSLGVLAVDRTDFVPGEKLEPIYLRETSFVKAPPPRVLPAE